MNEDGPDGPSGDKDGPRSWQKGTQSALKHAHSGKPAFGNLINIEPSRVHDFQRDMLQTQQNACVPTAGFQPYSGTENLQQQNVGSEPVCIIPDRWEDSSEIACARDVPDVSDPQSRGINSAGLWDARRSATNGKGSRKGRQSYSRAQAIAYCRMIALPDQNSSSSVEEVQSA